MHNNDINRTDAHTQTQPFNSGLSGTTRVGWYQQKHSPTQEEGFTPTTRSALSQRGLLETQLSQHITKASHSN